MLGKNGSGKSTLLRTLSNVQPKLKGTVYLHEKELSSYSEKELASELSLVLTDRLPESQLTVFELVALGRQPYTNWLDNLTEQDTQKIQWAIEQTEIQDLTSHFYHELSDGQLQRVLIARALAQDTDFIILDEPTAHLDLHHTLTIFALLKKLVNTTHKTILISTHEINLALQIADEFIVLNNNSCSNGSPHKLIDHKIFNSLFSSELISFDTNLNQFVINKNKI